MNRMKFSNNSNSISTESSLISNRIPLALQAVFLESNQGTEIHVPPSNNVANKVFVPGTNIDKTNSKKWDRYGVSKKFKELAARKALQLRRYTTCSSRKSSSKRKILKGKNQSSDKSTTSETTASRKKRQTRKAIGTRSKKVKIPLPTLSPQEYLTGLLRSRGYCTKQYNAIDIGYNTKPTPLQKASYGSYMIEVVKKDNEEKRLVQLLKCGLSSNPCNDFGESIVHMVCRLGKLSMLQSLLEYGCDIHVADINGRTPLHEACWSHKPQFRLVDMLLQIDPQLLLVSDIRNTLPLSFAPRQCWTEWLQYIESKKDIYWPKQNQYLDRTLQEPKWNISSSTPQLLNPNTRLVKQKKVPILPLKVVSLVATGKVDPREALILSLDLDDLSYADDSDEWFSNYTNGIDDDDDDDDEVSESDANDSKNEIDTCLLDNSEGDDDDDDEDDKDASSRSNCNDDKLTSPDPTAAMPISTDETEFLLDENEMTDLLYCFNTLTKGFKYKKGGGVIWMSGADRCQTNTMSSKSTCYESYSSTSCIDDSCTSDCSGSTTSCECDDASNVSTTTTTTTSSEQDLIDCTSILRFNNNSATIMTKSLDEILEKMVDVFFIPDSNDIVVEEYNHNSEIVEKHVDIKRFSDLDPEMISLMYFY